MNLIRLGSRYINLSYLILAEEWDAPALGPAIGPGCLRVTVETGRVIDLAPPDADKLRRKLDDLLDEPSAAEPPPVPGRVRVAGAPVRQVKRRKGRG